MHVHGEIRSQTLLAVFVWRVGNVSYGLFRTWQRLSFQVRPSDNLSPSGYINNNRCRLSSDFVLFEVH